MAKSWQQKLDGGKPPHVKILEKRYCGAPPGAIMLISQPREVDTYMRAMPPGTTHCVADMRADLAKRHSADITCPVSTGIFARIAAEAALDELAAGKPRDEVTPFWRVIDPASDLAKKLSCGLQFIAEQREREGRH